MNRNIINEIQRQSQGIETWTFVCDICQNYKDNLVCSKGVFIAFKGANLSGCFEFQGGKKCNHCGRIT